MSMATGINLFSVHEQLADDYFGTLEKVAAAGYRNIELIGFNMKKLSRFSDEFAATDIQASLDRLGLQAIAMHEAMMPGQDILAHDWDAAMKYCDGLGCPSIVLPSVMISDEESALKTAEQLNRLGSQMKERGFRLYVHNHAHEFKKAGEVALLELLADNTDPAHLKFELDLVWVMRAGTDPIAVLKRLGDRCDMIHQKDLNKELAGPLDILEAMKQNGNEHLGLFEAYGKYVAPTDFVDLGTGAFDFATVYAKLKEMGYVRYALVENEGKSADKIQSIANDLIYLQKFV
ncbi:sugar phosphate isomerase/epimerase family protein [Paenibacillus sp. GCM10027626]|uniref:sugar phosphate isomerase/epimerase family protein n=1 Tax=Paenibacillus sp. GCM10027626 TaxID=3273411 RepID=UPI003641AE9E